MGEAWTGLIRREGPRALWKGLGANMLRVAPYGAINFFVYDWCKSAYLRRCLAPGERMTAAPTLVFGGLAGKGCPFPLHTIIHSLFELSNPAQAAYLRGTLSIVLYTW